MAAAAGTARGAESGDGAPAGGGALVTLRRALPWLLVALAIAVWAGPLQHGWYADAVITDIPVYRQAADRMMDGEIPYRDFALEYPPLAAGLFLLVGLVPGDFAIAFQIAMAACLCATVLGVVATARALGLSLTRQAAAGTLVAVSPLLLGNLVESRFDLALTALLSWTLYAAAAGRRRLMWGLFAAATLTKLIPLALAPILVLYDRRRAGGRAAWSGLAAALGAVALATAPFVALSASGTWGLVEYHLDRPLQIESLGAAYLLGLDVLADIPIRVVNAFGSQGLDGRGPDVIAGLTSLAVLAAVVAIAVGARSLLSRAHPPADARLLTAAWTATIAAVLAGGKVLSPQFLLWLLPAAFLVGGRYGLATAGITILALLLTQAYFPHRYWDLVALGRPEIGLLVLRDLTLVGLVAAAWPRSSVAARTRGVPPQAADAPTPESAVAARFLAD
jgi:hypothetical protein